MKEQKRLDYLNKKKTELLSNPELTKKQKSKLREMRGEIAYLEDAIEAKRRRAERLLKRSNLGERFINRTFEAFNEEKQMEAYATCLHYAKAFETVSESPKNSLIIIGSYGTGKTHLAASIVNYVVEEFGTMCLFNTWAGHLEEIKTSWLNDRGALKTIREIPLLIIDDYGKDKASDWNDEMMFEVINYRYEHNLPTIMTTNLSGKALRTRIGDAVHSRMCESFIAVEMNGEDQRGSYVEK